MKLRPYQQAAADAIFAAWRDVRSTLLVLPTGTGKTIVFSDVARRIAGAGGQTLILAHRDELIRQAVDKLQASTGLIAAVEKADEYAAGTLAPVTVASVQTLMRGERLRRFPQDQFAAIVVDEAHHALAESYRGILGYFGGAKILGVTATPDRGDKRNLGSVFESFAYEYGLPDAVRDGWLARPVVQTCPIRLDLTGVRTTAGDYNAADLGEALAPYAPQIVEQIAGYAGNRKTLLFLPLVATSKAFCTLLQAAGMDARHVDGTSDDRADVAAWLATPGPKVCCNAMLYTEGFDEPSIDAVCVLRATKSRPLYAQMIGRGTRLFPGKRDLLILDFLWHTARHELCTPASLVAAKADVAAEMDAMQERAAGKPEQLDLLDMAEAASGEVARQRHEALAEMIRTQARKQARRIDPLAFALSIDAADLGDYEPVMPWESAPATRKQLDAIARFGLDPDRVTCRGHAKLILDKLIGRSRAGLASAQQIRLLARYNYNAASMRRKDASALIDAIKANGWRRPEPAFD